MRQLIRAAGLSLVLAGASFVSHASVGDPQLRTDHDWYPGELAISTFNRMFAFQASVYSRETGRTCNNDEDKVIASWYFRNWMFYHSFAPNENIPGHTATTFASNLSDNSESQYEVLDYWAGLFSYGFAYCGVNHGQYTAEMEKLLGHGRGRVVNMPGHGNMEVFLNSNSSSATAYKDYENANGDWALLDNDLSTLVFDNPTTPTRLRSLWDIVYSNDPNKLITSNTLTKTARSHSELETILDNDGAPDANRGWYMSSLYFPNADNANAEGSDAMGYEGGISHTAPYYGFAGVPPIINLRPGERFRRYVKPGLDDGSTFVFWGPNFYTNASLPGPGVWRDRTWTNHPDQHYRTTDDSAKVYARDNGRFGNGVYTWAPNFTNSSYQEGVINETSGDVTFDFYSPYAIAATPANTGLLASPNYNNVQPGATNGLIITSAASSVTVQTSIDRGATWSTAKALSGSVDLTDDVKGYHQYFIRFNAGAPALSGLNIEMRTVVMLNDCTVPRLADSNSTVTYQASGKAVLAAGPTIPQAAAFGYALGNTVTMTLDTPNSEKILELYVVGKIASGVPPTQDPFHIQYSTNGGSTWTYIVQNWKCDLLGYQTGDWHSTAYLFGDINISAANASSVQVKFWSGAGRQYLLCNVYAVYETPNDNDMEVTYSWTDSGGAKQASHTYSAGQTTPDSSWVVPTTTSVETKWVEMRAIEAGYSVSGTVSGVVSNGVTLTLTDGGSVNRTTTTASGGVFTFASVSPGTYTLTPSLSGYTFTPASRSVTVSTADVSAQNFTSATVPTYPVSGQVNIDGIPTTSVLLTVLSGGTVVDSCVLDATGNYSINLPNGSYTLELSLDGYVIEMNGGTAVVVSGGSVSNNVTATGIKEKTATESTCAATDSRESRYSHCGLLLIAGLIFGVIKRREKTED
ncbi:MAG: carboxypeptidase-like regulatory domain-containing protein [Planctomycetota bacterium]